MRNQYKSHLAGNRKHSFGSKSQAHVLHVLLSCFADIPGFPDLLT